MRAAVISFTEKGRKLSGMIVEKALFTQTERFCFHRHSDASSHAFEKLSALTADIFTKFDVLVYVCACGIAVRAVAPYLHSKTTDPAVIVIDDCGKFVIPILSGHIGGANAIADKLAELLGAQAVITTATDIGGHFSPDSFAAANGLIITDMSSAKAIASAVLDGERIGFVSDYEYRNMPDELSADMECRTGIYVGDGDFQPFSVTLRLVPKNIVLGIGCKRGTDSQTIEQAVLSVLEDAGISTERVRDIASIDLKSDESGLLEFCREYSLVPRFYTAKELEAVSGEFTSSDFVKNVTGVDCVCERSAVRCSGGELIIRKKVLDGVTVAAAEIPLILDFERRML